MSETPAALNRSWQFLDSVAGQERWSGKGWRVSHRSPGRAGRATADLPLGSRPRQAGTGWRDRHQRQNPPDPGRGEEGGR